MLKKLLQLTLVSLLFSACGEEQKSVSPQTQEKPELQLQQASFRELNGFSQDNLTEAFHAFELSCMLPVLPASAISIPFTASRMTSLSLIPGILTRKCPPADWWAEWKAKSWFLIIPGGKL